jgi:hypothetical protein
LVDGIKMLEVPLWRSYLAGCILLGIAPCTAMVLVWGFLSRGNDGLTLVMVAINSLTMLLLYGVLGGFSAGCGAAARALAGAAAVHRHLRGPAPGGRIFFPPTGSSPPKEKCGSRRNSCTCSRPSPSLPC